MRINLHVHDVVDEVNLGNIWKKKTTVLVQIVSFYMTVEADWIRKFEIMILHIFRTVPKDRFCSYNFYLFKARYK